METEQAFAARCLLAARGVPIDDHALCGALLELRLLRRQVL